MLWGEYNYDEDIAAQRQEAFDDGIAQGSQQTRIDTAKALLSEGISIDVITRTTGLSTEAVKQLAREMEDCKILVQ